jgi:uncharacterized protein YerC
MTKNFKPRITAEKRDRIIELLDKRTPIKSIAAETAVSIPSIYKINRTRPEPDEANIDAIAVLEKQVSAAEARISDLEKTILEIESLRNEVEVKKSVIKSLRALQEKS